MDKSSDNPLQPSLPPPAGGSMLPGPNPVPASPSTGGPSWNQPWNFQTYGLPNLSNPSHLAGVASAGKGLLAPPVVGAPAGGNPAGGLGTSPAAAQVGNVAQRIGQGAGQLTNHLFSGIGSAAAPLSGMMNSLSAPPLTHLTHHLGEGIKPYADGALNFIQRGIQGPGGAQRFATFASMAKPLLGPVMETPLGAPLLAGAYGMLGGRGAQGAADVRTLAAPLLKRLGG